MADQQGKPRKRCRCVIGNGGGRCTYLTIHPDQVCGGCGAPGKPVCKGRKLAPRG